MYFFTVHTDIAELARGDTMPAPHKEDISYDVSLPPKVKEFLLFF